LATLPPSGQFALPRDPMRFSCVTERLYKKKKKERKEERRSLLGDEFEFPDINRLREDTGEDKLVLDTRVPCTKNENSDKKKEKGPGTFLRKFVALLGVGIAADHKGLVGHGELAKIAFFLDHLAARALDDELHFGRGRSNARSNK